MNKFIIPPTKFTSATSAFFSLIARWSPWWRACEYYLQARHTLALILMLLWVLENMISASFWVYIAKILLELLWKMLRFAVYVGPDRYKRLVLCVSLAFLLQTLFSPIITWRWSTSLNLVRRHPNDREVGVHCTWIRAWAYEWMNTVYGCNSVNEWIRYVGVRYCENICHYFLLCHTHLGMKENTPL